MATLGNTTAGGSADSLYADYAFAVKVTTPSTITVQSLLFYASGGSASPGRNVKGVIWLQSGGSVVDVGTITTVNAFGGQWYTSTFSDTELTDATDYWIGVISDGGGSGGGVHYDGTVGYWTYDYENNYSSPATFVPHNFGSQGYYSVYINYTAGGGGPSGPSLLVEGITPGTIEGLDWANVNTIK